MNGLVLTVAALAMSGAGAEPSGAPVADPILSQQVEAARAALRARYGEQEAARVDRGLAQVAALWRKEDGDLAAFAQAHFQPEGPALQQTFGRLEGVLEQLDGHYLEMGRALRWATEVDVGPLLAVDPLLAAMDPSTHGTDDLFASKVAFVALLNFPEDALKDREEQGAKWSRQRWAESRLTGRFARRVPADVQAQVSAEYAKADLYIAQYNVWMHHLLDERGQRLFPSGKRLITHWNLRDELKANYAEGEGGLAKQRMIAQVMARIVTQTIPRAVIDNPRVDWNPYTNAVWVAPEAEVEKDAPERDAVADPAREPDTRYERILGHFRAARLADPYSPIAPTALARSFELERELPEERVAAMLEQVLASPLVPKVAQEIERRLGRKLEPQDVWYNGFAARGRLAEDTLDRLTRQRYPTAEAFAKDIPRILAQLGFERAKARYLAAHILVDPSRGAGHAMEAARRGDFPHLRTRVEKGGMNYKGYNIATHELGHNVEQVFSLYEVDHTLLAGVPNNSFTEALAFVFQARDLELLGRGKKDADAERLRVLDDFWSAYEIAGVALVDVGMWHWMYEHPNATPAQLREAVVALARKIWNRYYAPVLGGEGSVLLGIYSHLITNPLYLCNYPLGHFISFQIEEQVRKNGKLGPEFERMARQGRVTPDAWMIGATGAPVGPQALLAATAAALAR